MSKISLVFGPRPKSRSCFLFTDEHLSGAAAHDQAPGGARRDRTDDLMLAKHALSQLSYGPKPHAACVFGLASVAGGRIRGLGFRAKVRGGRSALRPFGPKANDQRRRLRFKMVGLGRLELPTSRLSSARSNQLSYKPKDFPGFNRDPERPRPNPGLIRKERETRTAMSRI